MPRTLAVFAFVAVLHAGCTSAWYAVPPLNRPPGWAAWAEIFLLAAAAGALTRRCTLAVLAALSALFAATSTVIHLAAGALGLTEDLTAPDAAPFLFALVFVPTLIVCAAGLGVGKLAAEKMAAAH